MITAEEVLQIIKDEVDKHEFQGMTQWYVSEFNIDCDAEEFWKVVLQALRKV
jgi:hypothetical protein